MIPYCCHVLEEKTNLHISRRELPHKLIKEALTELIQQTLIERAHFTWNGYFMVYTFRSLFVLREYFKCKTAKFK